MRAGIAVNSLGMSQMSFELTRELNKLEHFDEYWDIIVFYHVYARAVKAPQFALMQQEELWGYDAPVMATDLATADRLLKAPRPTKKFLYVWDLEWTMGQFDIDILASVYMHKDLHLVARSKEHYDIISDCWKEPVDILEGFNYEQLTKIFSQAG